jgi:hypothetical protein
MERVNKNSFLTSKAKISKEKRSISNNIKSNNQVVTKNLNLNNNMPTTEELSELLNSKVVIKTNTKDNSKLVTGLVRDKDNPNKAELHQYKIKTTSQAEPELYLNNSNSRKIAKKQTEESKMITNVILNTVKSNKLTWGIKKMMENERVHAKEAIECGIYVTWTSKATTGEVVDCFRIGSESMCICGHGFPSHEKIVTRKKFSTKCSDCKCKYFAYIPLYPEEIGEYWMPYQDHFNYTTWKAKCKCKHTWNEHTVDPTIRCKKCSCFAMSSNFCCAVCDKFWQDHEMLYELEHERYMNKKPIGEDFIPFAEMPEMYEAVYKNKK